MADRSRRAYRMGAGQVIQCENAVQPGEKPSIFFAFSPEYLTTRAKWRSHAYFPSVQSVAP